MINQLKIMIVEDDLLIADITEAILDRSGFDVCGIARNMKQAEALDSLHQPDIALIDFRLANGDLGTDVAVLLSSKRKIGILYATGNNSEVSMRNAVGHGCLSKPYRPDDLLRGIAIVVDMLATGATVPPYPRGFKILHQTNHDKLEERDGCG